VNKKINNNRERANKIEKALINTVVLIKIIPDRLFLLILLKIIMELPSCAIT
jgi:hypothetical protein